MQTSWTAPIGLAIISAATWLIAWRTRVLRRFLEPEPRQPAPWGVIDLALTSLILLVPALVAAAVLTALGGDPAEPLEQLEPAQRRLLVLVLCAAQLVAAVVVVWAIAARSGATARDLGLNVSRWRSDVAVGVVGFLLLVGPVLLLQAALVQFWESKHPLVQWIADDPSWQTLSVVGIAAVVVAPLVEELVFRVLMQGWLEAVAALCR